MEKQQCIVTRSGSEFWLSEKKAQEVADILVNQKAHSFIRIAELGNRIINTADIVEICTRNQMDEKNRLKNKEWFCGYKTWHAKGHRCECAIEVNKKKRQAREEKEREEMNKPLTDEDQERIRKNMAETRKILESKGILAKKMKI